MGFLFQTFPGKGLREDVLQQQRNSTNKSRKHVGKYLHLFFEQANKYNKTV